ncbi:MAG: hypothetical protein JNK26_03535 [Candidatus Doudnabacteria bacterium]|nr:hypothetical protein [Candidatus Doudnabacteria bacterium]
MLLILATCVQLLLSIGVIALSLTPSANPAQDSWSEYTLVLLLLFFVVSAFEVWYLMQNRFAYFPKVMITISIFVIALTIGLLGLIPQAKTVRDAIVFNYGQTDTLLKARELVDKVKANELTISEAIDAINTQFADEGLGELGAMAIKQLLIEPDIQIVADDLTPKVPLVVDKWSCNEVGCAYTDNKFVWTISRDALLRSSLLSGMSLIAITAVLAWELRKLDKLKT